MRLARPNRLAISGLGSRLFKTYLPFFGSREFQANGCSIVAAVDTLDSRLEDFRRQWNAPTECYMAGDFERMLRESDPDAVLICNPDYAHFPQISLALEYGKNVICEKPMVLDTLEAMRVLELERESMGEVVVAHNFKFMNLNLMVKRLIEDQSIGRITQATFTYHIRPEHAASYFRRWHRHKNASGGLAVTKGCHHFDLLTWWLSDIPESVFAFSKLHHYTTGLYVEGHPPSTIPADSNIEDSINALLNYRNGALVSYTLNSNSGWEGYETCIFGTAGSLHASYVKNSEKPHAIQLVARDGTRNRFFLPREDGTHAGSDKRMLRLLFGIAGEEDGSLCKLSGALDGAISVSIGDAINKSSLTGNRVEFKSLWHPEEWRMLQELFPQPSRHRSKAPTPGLKLASS